MSTFDFESLTRDRLTGALSWHYFHVIVDDELERAGRYRRALSFVLLDVDDLRGLNDRFGRDAGDEVLVQVAQALTGGVRAVDRIGRWSGGGFALLLPETAIGAAYGLAERLRVDLGARRFLVGGTAATPSTNPKGVRLTVSCGVASLYAEGTPKPESLVARADHALFRAKLGGRNRSFVD
jgi:diguanylate cyclase (GGDEF)-like protein